MSFTNKTANYDLPQYIATDKPSYLVDANGAYLAIDTAMKANETAAATAQNTADTNTAAISTLNTQINGEDGLAADLTAVETLAGTTAGSVQTITQVIGSGTPTTTAQTLIGAINELDADKVPTGNILKYVGYHSFSVTGDGVKTYSALLNEIYSDFITYIRSKTDSYQFKAASLTIPGVGYLSISRDNAYHGKNTSDTFNFFSIAVGTNVIIARAYLHPSSSAIDSSSIGATYTASDLSNTAPASGTTIAFSLEEYEFV